MNSLIPWLESLFRQRRDSLACLVTAILPLPLLLVFWVMPMIAQMKPEWAGLYRWDRVPFSQAVLALVIALSMVLARRAWHLRSDERDFPMFSLLTVFTEFSAVIVLSVGYGYKDSPLMLLCMGMLILVRAMFKPTIYKPVFIAMLLLFIINEIAFWTHATPYAPLLQHPIFTGKPLNGWWAFWLRVIYTMIAVPMVALFFLLAHIMNQEKKELEELVRTDALTGLLNRRAFMERFEIECARHQRKQKPFCLMMCDVDYFKKINDNYGHPAGDQVLAQLGRILQQSTRRNSDVAARFGGEEFVVLLPETQLEQARRIAEHIAWQLRVQEFEAGGKHFTSTLSIGLVEVSQGDIDESLRRADDNLYAAKEAGRDRIVATQMVDSPFGSIAG